MRSRFQQQLHDDSGVVAIIVALSISTFLLGFAALAVDAGVAYATKVELQSVADRLAVAAAGGLPDVGAATTAFSTSFTEACQDQGKQLWDGGVCAPGADFGWARNGARADGEIEFFAPTTANTPLDFGILPAAPQATPAAPTAVRVVLPPVTVPFGFGSYFGVDSADIQKAATARIGTALGAGILPFAATRTDISNGQFCVVDQAVPPVVATGSTYPTRSASARPRLRIDAPAPATVTYQRNLDGPTDVTLTLVLRNMYSEVQNLKVYLRTAATPIEVQDAERVLVADGIFAYQVTVPIPAQDPGVNLQIWLTGQQRSTLSRWRNFASDSVQLAYAGRPVDDADPCALPQASGRGYIDLTRRNPVDTLENNVRRGPQVQLYPQTLLDPVLNTVGDLCVQKIFQPKTSCVASNGTTGFSTALRQGLFEDKDGARARLKGNCGNGTTDSGTEGGVDASRLVGTGADPGMLDSRTSEGYGTGTRFRQVLVSGAAAPQRKANGDSWVSGQALRCPRMAVLPVISNSPSALDVVLSGGKEITGFVYLWIDGIDAARGITWNGNELRSLSGYVIDPNYLPAVVAGSPVVGPYLGAGMPKEATLICDLWNQGDPDADPPRPDRCADQVDHRQGREPA